MPISPEPDCWVNLHQMSSDFGQVFNEAINHGTWDKATLAEIGQNLSGLVNNCRLLGTPDRICRGDATALMDGLVAILRDESYSVDPDKVEKQMEAIGQPIADLIGCLYDHYAIASEIMIEDTTFSDWPDDNWISQIRPERVAKRKR
jgi:hypothetical protein